MDNGTDDTVNALAFSPDGSLLAAAGGTTEGLTRDNSIRLWDSTTFVVLQGLTGHRAAVRALAFNPDGTRLASVAEDDTLRLWGVAAASG
jgi:WD40 repeat protein